MTRTRPAYARALLLGVLLTAALLGTSLVGTTPTTWAPPAAAHAGLVDSDPADGSTVAGFDGEVVLTFSEEVTEPVTVIVTDPEGTGLQSGDPVVDGTRVRQSVDPAVVAGLHTIAYRVISSDGHPITGQVRVTVEAPEGEPEATEPASTPSPDEEGPTDEEPDTAPRWVPVAVLGALLAALVGVGVAVRRRKQT